MRLLKINGDLWNLSLLQASSEKWADHVPEEANDALIRGRSSCYRGIIRFKAGDLRAKATALIEIIVHGFPHQHQYEIYYNKKGFYCIVQKQRIFLKDILEQQS